MKKSTKTIILSIALCMISALGVFCVFAVKNFSIRSGGTIEFIAPGVDATISAATLTGISQKADSASMSEFTVTRTMTESQIQALDGYKSWNGIKLLFDDDSEGRATISFTITNNSQRNIENIMVELSSNTTNVDVITATPSADFCIMPGENHTFDVALSVADTNSSSKLSNFQLSVALRIIKPSEVPSVQEYKQNTGLTIVADATTKSARVSGYTAPSSTASKTLSTQGPVLEIPGIIKDDNNNIYTITEIGRSAFANKTFPTGTQLVLPNTIVKINDSGFDNCKGFGGQLIIPDSVEYIGSRAFYTTKNFTGLTLGKNVKTIGYDAFYICNTFTGPLILPDSLQTIGEGAFSNCTKFTGDLIIPDSVKTIEYAAFDSCSGLNGNLTIGDGIETIPGRVFDWCNFAGILTIGKSLKSTTAFQYCDELSGIVVDKANPNLYSAGNCLIDKATGTLIKGSDNSVIPNDGTIKKIAANAFYQMRKITGDLIIPDSVTSIGDGAFFNCWKWEGKLVIGKNVETIGARAFDSGKFTGDLIIPDSVKTIGTEAFNACFDLDGELVIGDGVTSVGARAFQYVNCTGKLKVGKNLTTIGTDAFKSCSDLTSIEIDAQNQSFYSEGNCFIEKSTKKLILGCRGSVIPNGVEIISASAFHYCNFLTTDLIIPDSVTTIEAGAFSSSSGKTGVLHIGKNLANLPNSVFSSLSGITSITVDAQNAQYKAVNNCLIETATKTIVKGCINSTIPTDGSVENIGHSAFYSVKFSGEFVIPEGIKTIDTSAFYSNNFTSLIIPSTVTTIGNSAFYYCTALTSVTINATTPATLGGTSCFDSIKSTCKIYVPANSVSAYQTATNWSEYASKIVAIGS